MEHFWTASLSAGGIGAVGAFVFLSLYKGWLRLEIFEKVSASQTFRLMIVCLVLTFSFAIAALASFVLSQPPPKVISPALTIEQLRNATYPILIGDLETVTLRDGKREFVDSKGENTVYATLTEWALGDFTGGGSLDAAAVVEVNTGGSGAFVYLIPVVNRFGVPESLNHPIALGDRAAIRSIYIKNQILTLEYLAPGPNDPACCPSLFTSINFKFKGADFICADEKCDDATAKTWGDRSFDGYGWHTKD